MDKSKGKVSIVEYCRKTGGEELLQHILSQFTGKDVNGKQYSADELSYGSGKMLYWKCPNGHLTLYTPNHKLKYPYVKCPECNETIKKTMTLDKWCKQNEFGSKLKSYWTGLAINGKTINFNEILFDDETEVQWKCPQGHTWYQSIKSITAGRLGCIICREKRRVLNSSYSLEFMMKSNSIEDELIGTQKIGNVTPKEIWYKSKIITVWKCKNNHIYKIETYKKFEEKYKCPYCIADETWGEKSLEFWCNNNGKKGQIIKKAWTGKCVNGTTREMIHIDTLDTTPLVWKCNTNHTYIASVKDMIYKNMKCPTCIKKSLGMVD